MEAHPTFLRIDSAGGPALIAHVFEGMPPVEESDWHRHLRGQFMYVESGTVCVRTQASVWALTPHRVGWMPPGELHTVSVVEPTCGWGVFVAPHAATGLPAAPAVLRGNDLMRALVHRAAGWADSDALDLEQQRVMDVLMDEMRRAQMPDEPLNLPMPADRRLLRVARELLAHPDDGRGLEEWASWAGLSARSLSRLFRSETGCSFAQWRQQARLTRALQHLVEGATVASIADALGYASVSAFVAMFRRSLGQSPGRYLSLRTTATS